MLAIAKKYPELVMIHPYWRWLNVINPYQYRSNHASPFDTIALYFPLWTMIDHHQPDLPLIINCCFRTLIAPLLPILRTMIVRPWFSNHDQSSLSPNHHLNHFVIIHLPIIQTMFINHPEQPPNHHPSSITIHPWGSPPGRHGAGLGRPQRLPHQLHGERQRGLRRHPRRGAAVEQRWNRWCCSLKHSLSSSPKHPLSRCK